MKKLKMILLTFTVLVLSSNLSAQELKVDTSSINIQQLPEYVIVTSENTKLIGGIGIIVDSKKSKYENQLLELESLLQDRKKLSIRNQTDLLNAMLNLGFEYVNAYISSSSGSSLGGDEFVGINDSKSRVSMVFRKKSEFRN